MLTRDIDKLWTSTVDAQEFSFGNLQPVGSGEGSAAPNGLQGQS